MQTTVYVPLLHFANGYAAAVSGARIVSAPGASALRLRNGVGAGSVALTIRPAG